MAEIVVVTWDGGGNVPPAFAIAAELAARGHGIRVLGHRSQREAIEAAGFTPVTVRETRDFTVGGTHSDRELIATFGDRGTGRDLRAELARQRADLVLVDALTIGALDAVRTSGVRYAVLEHFFDGYYQGLLRGPLGVVLRAKGLRPGSALRGAAVRLVTSLPELDDVRPGAPVCQVGPVVTWAPRVAGEPTVLVSLSTFGYAGMSGSAPGRAGRLRRARRPGRGDHRPARRPRVAARAGRGRGAPVRPPRRADAARERRRRSRRPRHRDDGRWPTTCPSWCCPWTRARTT